MKDIIEKVPASPGELSTEAKVPKPSGIAVRSYCMTRAERERWLDNNMSDSQRVTVRKPRPERQTVKEIRERMPEKTRRRATSLLVSIIICICVLLFVCTAFIVFSCFKVTSVTLVTGSSYSEEELVAASQIVPGQKLVGLDVSSREKKICESFALIENCDISRHLDGRVEIRVSEYNPVIYAEENGKYYSYTRDLYCVETYASADTFESAGLMYAVLPEVSRSVCGSYLEFADGDGDYITVFLEEAKKAGILGDVSCLDFSDRYAISLTDKSGTSVRYGSVSDLSKKILTAQRVIEETENTGSVNVDVSSPGTAYVTRADGDSE